VPIGGTRRLRFSFFANEPNWDAGEEMTEDAMRVRLCRSFSVFRQGLVAQLVRARA
jgi:hypothetical protein